jgi:hypothetical protein
MLKAAPQVEELMAAAKAQAAADAAHAAVSEGTASTPSKKGSPLVSVMGYFRLQSS